MLKEKFEKKYDGAIRSVAVANEVDMAVARDMLIYEARVASGDIQRVDTYHGVPDGFNLARCYKDYKSITD